MSAVWLSLYRDERGFVLTAELIIISTVLVLGLITGLSAIQTSVVGELRDVGGAIGSLNQSYCYTGMKGCRSWCGLQSRTYGSSFLDVADSREEVVADFGAGMGAGFGAFGGAWVAPPLPPMPLPPVIVPPVVPCLPDVGVPGSPQYYPGSPIPPPACANPWTPGVPSPGNILLPPPSADATDAEEGADAAASVPCAAGAADGMNGPVPPCVGGPCLLPEPMVW